MWHAHQDHSVYVVILGYYTHIDIYTQTHTYTHTYVCKSRLPFLTMESGSRFYFSIPAYA